MNRTSLLLAATMTLGGLTLAPGIFAADAPAANNAGMPKADTAQQAADVSAVRTLIANSTDAAVHAGQFNDLIGDFAVPPTNAGNNPAHMNAAVPTNENQESANKTSGTPSPAAAANTAGDSAVTPEQNTKLNNQIDQFQNLYKTKYGQEFSIKDAQTLYGDITSADLNEPEAQPAAAEIKGSTSADARTTPPSSANTATPSANAGESAANNAIQSAEWITLSVPEYQNAPAVKVYLVREGNTFRYATKSALNQQALAENLTDCLTKLNADQAHWPTDPNTAERLVSQHVLGAIQKTQESEMNGNGNPANPATPASPANPANNGGTNSMK